MINDNSFKEENFFVREQLDMSHLPDRLDKQWYVNYLKLRNYKSIYGHVNVPTRWIKDPSLGKWTSFQRQQFRSGNLISWRSELLLRLNIDCELKVISGEQLFSQRIKDLETFKKKYGHVSVPISYKTGEINLGKWVSYIRVKKEKWSEEQRALLENMGFAWKVNEKPQKIDFSYIKNEIEIFLRENNGFSWPMLDRKNKKVHDWLVKTKQRPDRVNQEDLEILKSFGFPFINPNLKDKIIEKIKLAKEQDPYFNINLTGDIEINKWLTYKRDEYRAGKLNKEVELFLNEQGMNWYRRNISQPEIWTMAKKIVYHHTIFNSFEINLIRDTNPLLYSFAKSLMRYRKKTPSELLSELKKAGFPWKIAIQPQFPPINGQWEIQFKKLQSFYLEHGNSRINLKQEPQLYEWARRQRTLYRKNNLSSQKLDLLNSIHFPWDLYGAKPDDHSKPTWNGEDFLQRENLKSIKKLNYFDYLWYTNYLLLKDYIKTNGRKKIPVGRYNTRNKIGVWSFVQKAMRKKLHPWKIELLNTIDFFKWA